MTIRDLYTKINSDYNVMIQRMGSEALIERFVLKFLDDKTYQGLKDSIESGDVELMFRGAHTLKGVALNLGFDDLAETSSALTEQLRSKEENPNPALVEAVDKAYQQVIEVIKAYQLAC